MYAKCFSLVPLFVTRWTVAHQGLLTMGLSRQESWSGLPCPPVSKLTQMWSFHRSVSRLFCLLDPKLHVKSNWSHCFFLLLSICGVHVSTMLPFSTLWLMGTVANSTSHLPEQSYDKLWCMALLDSCACFSGLYTQGEDSGSGEFTHSLSAVWLQSRMTAAVHMPNRGKGTTFPHVIPGTWNYPTCCLNLSFSDDREVGCFLPHCACLSH